MVISREMKRKRKDECASPFLDDSPKRTKVHAQRKFAQGSNVNSPVITPVKEIERQDIDVMPEPVELLPIKRPNTEDFLTFLCFRGTPILPPSLNFFNTASIVDTNGQVHEIKSESPKNGPIDTSAISKSGSGSSERPFIAFGVRKRADPIVISRQMDKKRRHALALQALRRKYQEQRMAKIRAVTISKLSEKVTNKSLVRSNSVTKTETVTKKTSMIQKSSKVNVVATKQVKVTTETVKTTLRPQIKPKMCLRSFRGRFVQKELQFRNVKKKPVPVVKKITKKIAPKKNEKESSEYSSDDDEPLAKTSQEKKLNPKILLPKICKKSAPGPKKPSEINFRITRSNKFLTNKITSRRQQLKQLILTTPKIIVKPRTLRSHSAQKGDIFPKPKLLSPAKQKLMQMRKHKELEKIAKETAKKETPEMKKSAKIIPVKKEPVKREVGKLVEETKKESVKVVEVPKKAPLKIGDNVKKQVAPSAAVKGKVAKSVGTRSDLKMIETLKRREQERIKLDTKKIAPVSPETDKSANKSADNQAKKDVVHKKSVKSPPVTKKEPVKIVETNAKKETKTADVAGKKEEAIKGNAPKTAENKEPVELKTSQRPTRKTKEAAAIYMEILSHKLVNEDKIDDDNVSIDSFPELPNVKKTEQRENELKAQAKSSKTSEAEGDGKKGVKSKEYDNAETKTLRSVDKKKGCLQKKVEAAKMVEIEDDAGINEMVLKGIEKIDAQLKERDELVETKVEEKDVKKAKKSLEETRKVLAKVKEDTKDESPCDRKTRSSATEKPTGKLVSLPVDKIKEVELKVHINPIDFNVEKKITSKEIVVKRKLSDSTNDGSVSEDSERQIKIKKPAEISVDVTTGVEGKRSKVVSSKTSPIDATRRQTRNSSQIVKEANSDDSDESFRVDIKVPKKTQVTRSKVGKPKDSSAGSETSKASVEIKKVLRAKTKSYTEFSSTESDQSTTSDVNVKPLKPTGKAKRFTKTRSQLKGNQSFSDSDEEPLSKLTQSKTSGAKETKTDSEDKQTNEAKTSKDSDRKLSPQPEISAKPKRECAKRPQNYLPMFSSSDDEEKYFHGFKMKSEPKKAVKIVDETCAHLPQSSDLSFKDIGRRFGKGKVNMSNEQIEKWLKDSAMAGSSIKTENDEMLKFGEKIPTETSFNIANTIDTLKLKASLLLEEDEKRAEANKAEVKSLPKPNPDKVPHKLVAPKPLLVDRKLIFRKDKVFTIPNVNAFSASNESSIYAFGEESEEIMKTPFRRPSRRPSSTATSRSEDESSKVEDLPKPAQFRKPLMKQDLVKKDDDSEEIINVETDDDHFYTPTQPSKLSKSKVASSMSCSMVPPAAVIQRKLTDLKNSMKSLRNSADAGDEFKYKIPSSPSASSSSSAKLYKRQNLKFRATEVLPVTVNDFPANGPGQLVEGLTFYPTEKEFQDPIEYIEKIRPRAEQFGICRIVPPSTFKPECKVTDDMRFTAYNQYVHKLLHRWGPNFKELMAIKKYLSTQNISLTHPPWIGGMEIDLPRLYQTVQLLGGLKEVIEKKKWPRVSDAMKIPKSAQDRVTKLDDIYCKYLLPYDTLSPAEREKLFDEVETEWAKRESKLLLKAQQNLTDEVNESESESDNEAEECIVKGRNMALNAFYRIARNTMSMWFKTSEPSAQEVEQEYWKHVTLKQNHLCVHSGSIDSGSWGYGFAVSKNSPFARHAWNLKVLTNNSGSVLRSLGPIMGVTVPTLHVGMVFSSCCWYRDPHSLPWIEYLHTGGSKIWYGIPDSTSSSFQSALKKLVPNYCRNKTLWLPSDTVMVPPNLLVESGVSLSRIVQEPGQFIVVFPKVFTSSISTGYVVSESVYFAPPHWLNSARVVFDELRNSCEPSMLSLDRLVLSIVNDHRSSVEVLRQVIPFVKEICDKEKTRRATIKSLGVTDVEKLPLPEAPNARKRKRLQDDDGDYECEFCRMNLFVSMVTESQEDGVYCLDHAIEQIEKKKVESKNCKLSYTYDDDELEGLPGKIISIIESKLRKKIPHKFSGMPTLLTK